jgi:lipoate-protein ligase A
MGLVAVGQRAVRICELTGPAVVLGSTQPMGDVDSGAALRLGLDVVRRRSGGGAVLVEPGAVAWVDVSLPRSDPLWEDDVGRSFGWLGEAWCWALSAVGTPGCKVHRGPAVKTRWSGKVCFAGLGPGEVTVGGRKVVGMAQRRTRDGALFQCAVPLAWQPERLLDVLSLTPEERAAAVKDLGTVAVPVDAAGDELEAALLAYLP